MFDPTQVPRCLALSPDVFESFLVADRIHGMPETVMLKGHQLAITRKIAKRLMFQRHGVQLCQIVKYARLEHEKSAIDPGLLRVNFLSKVDDLAAIEFQTAESSRRLYRGYSGKLSVGTMKTQ